MTVPNTAAFNLDLSEIIEEAFERCGSELRSGYDLRTARRSMNLLFADWANRGINLWTVPADKIATMNIEKISFLRLTINEPSFTNIFTYPVSFDLSG